ncbi:ATP-dependent DNA helicase UvrD/PcrA (EC [Olavius algarvensis Delta 1 endosymbiont]|nr:ATP-dependent DNA helicase UvrD/PcrA (EC [Olavius algarvensis Delta 1 endosymbiont]
MSAEIKLNSQQEAAARYNGSARNLLVMAGAGCGKTRTIIARTSYMIRSGVDASRILMMTFTNRAAREMKMRLNSEVGPVSHKVQAGTFHAFCLKVMRRIPNSFGIQGLNVIDVDDQNALMSLVRRRRLGKKGKEISKLVPRAAELIRSYSYCRNTCREPIDYLSHHSELSQEYIGLCSDMFAEYQKMKFERGYLDFDDLLEVFGTILEKKAALRKDLAALYDECLVDEMQDTNPLQFRILQQFSREGVRLFCVGDPAQSIYRFRGANFEHVYLFEKLFQNSEILMLSKNYRSYQEILDLSNWLLNQSPLDYKNKLAAHRGHAGRNPEIIDFDSKFEESSWIADKIMERYESDVRFQDMMVLVRTAFDAKPIEVEFIQREIPYAFIGGTSLTKSAHVRDILALLRIGRSADDDLAWMRYLRLWPGIGPKTAEKIVSAITASTAKNVLEVLPAQIGHDHPAAVGYSILKDALTSIPKAVESAIQTLSPVLESRYDRWHLRQKDLELLASVAGRYQSLEQFIDAFTLEPMSNTEIGRLEAEDAVTLITVHSAKGTEASICFVASAKPGTYPHVRSFGELESEEEERRILYVALTRAKNELFITRPADYRSGFWVMNSPTEGEEYFLADVPQNLVTHTVEGWSPSGSSRLASLKDIY